MRMPEGKTRAELRAGRSVYAASSAVKEAQAYVPGSYWGGMLHGSLGVKVDDFDPMKHALLWALINTPGVEISTEEYAAWSIGYDVLAKAMVTGVQQYYVEEGAEHLRTRQEPGAAFLNDLSQRSEAQEAKPQEHGPSEQDLAFLKNVADRANLR